MPPEPRILAFDTSAAHCAAALLCGDAPPLTRVEEMGRGQSERLVPMLEEILAEAGIAWRDLDALGVGTGPGNFTGIRIAVATARGLSLALGVPAIGVTSFEILRDGSAAAGHALVAVEAPRGMAYVQAFDGDVPSGEPRLVDPAEAGLVTSPVVLGSLPVLPARLARIAQRKLAGGTSHNRPTPLYIRPADAAPSRDAPPAILP